MIKRSIIALSVINKFPDYLKMIISASNKNFNLKIFDVTYRNVSVESLHPSLLGFGVVCQEEESAHAALTRREVALLLFHVVLVNFILTSLTLVRFCLEDALEFPATHIAIHLMVRDGQRHEVVTVKLDSR